jgi:RNA polymerase sigma factor (sigma-70 family)
MPDVDARTQTAQYRDVADDQSAARELQKELSLRLPFFYRCALRLLGNRADAEDAVQEALLAAYKHLHQFRGQSQMSTWLTTIVCNCARMQLRKRPRQIHMTLEEQIGDDERYFLSERLADTRPSPEDECRNSELAAHLRKCTPPDISNVPDRINTPPVWKTIARCRRARGSRVPKAAPTPLTTAFVTAKPSLWRQIPQPSCAKPHTAPNKNGLRSRRSRSEDSPPGRGQCCGGCHVDSRRCDHRGQ